MHIVTDNAFCDDNFCMKPFRGIVSAGNRRMQRFNQAQMAVRKDCECGWGMLVKRFPVFSHKIPYVGRDAIGRSARLIKAAFLLHNLCIRMGCDADADMLQYDSFGRLVFAHVQQAPVNPAANGGQPLGAGSKMMNARSIISTYIDDNSV